MVSALVGVLIGTATTLSVLAVQLWFNARQRERDRHMQLKRDVYLEASEGLAGTVEYIFQNTRTDLPLGAVKLPNERPGWLYKIHLVAGTDTLIAFNNAGAAAIAAALDVFTYRVAVAEVADEITIIRASSERIQRFQEEMKAEARTASVDVPSERTLKRLEWIQTQLDQSWVQLNDEAGKLERSAAEHARRTRTMIERSIVVASDVQKTVRIALLAARSELEISIDATKFEAAAASVDQRMTATMNRLLEHLN